MARYLITIFAIAAIILASAGSAGAASPSASIVSPSSPVEADMLERLEFIIRGSDGDGDLLLCEMYVDGAFKGRAYFESPADGATASFTYAFGTPGTHTVGAIPLDNAKNYGAGVTWTVEVTNHRRSLELTVLTYNTHLFEDSILECACRCGEITGVCTWDLLNYQDEIRRTEIISKIIEYGADIVALQEVWAKCWQQSFISDLLSTYPYSYNWDSSCLCGEACFGSSLWDCLYGYLNAIKHCRFDGCEAERKTLGNGLVLLSKWPLSDVEFERFPVFEHCSIGACEVWSDKGVLTATVDIGGPIRIGISHALTGPDDEKSKWDTNYFGTANASFQLNGETYIFGLDSDSKGHILQIEDYGRCWDEKAQKYNHGAGWKHIDTGTCTWGSEYDIVASFELDGHPYLFGLNNSNEGRITRINDDPSTGWTHLHAGNWGYDCISVTSFELDGHPYLFGVDDSNSAHIRRINDDPSTGWTETATDTWPSEYAAITSFDMNGHPYIFTHDGDQGHIRRINDDPCKGWSDTATDTWSSESADITSFELGGHPYIFSHGNTINTGRISRINDDPCTGWTDTYEGPRDENLTAWYQFEDNPFNSSINNYHGELYGDPTYSTDSREGGHSIELDGVDDYVSVGPVGISGSTPVTIAGWVKATKPADQIPGWRNVFGFTGPASDFTHFDIQCSNNSDDYCIHAFGWYANIAGLDQEWHHLAATYDGNEKKTWYHNGALIGTHDGGIVIEGNLQIGKREDIEASCFPGLVDDVRIYNRALAHGEITELAGWGDIPVFEMDGHPYLFALSSNCCGQETVSPGCRPRPGEVYLKRINDDPNTGWENVYQLEDIKIIRDETVVDDDGPPAIMMGDFNIHTEKYGIMDELFHKVGAVDAYAEIHGPGVGGETINWYENGLMQHFWPEVDLLDPHLVARIDYVYVKQTGGGRRLVPTEARVIREWKYGDDHMDLSDHYPLLVKFEMYPGGCTARMKGDLNCDRLINFADLSILGSAWMSEPNDAAWDPACDISDPADDLIDTKDVDAFSQVWLTMPPVHNVTQGTWYGFIQTAINDAQNGDEIEVAAGTYYEAINFKGKAITLRSTNPSDPCVVAETVIDGGGYYHVVKCVSGEDVSTVLNGFTITGGDANGPTGINKCGGGMYCENSSPTVTNCMFIVNFAVDGGGMFNYNSDPNVTNCTFSDNSSGSRGGGMFNDQ
jgi:endonuclease/exonuclease/phosphatase family metal-dependent hydrolase